LDSVGTVIESTPGTEASDVRQIEVRWVPRELKRDVAHLTSIQPVVVVVCLFNQN
jgi:hypothetical protein